jgi:tRNA threonylcarbamoyladenosine biosynthesis protein TsaE
MKKYVAKTAEETLALGMKMGQCIKQGDVIALHGELGAGKTVFAKGLAKGLQGSEEVTSPTFTLLRQFHGRLTLCHFDLYRIEDEEELEHIGFHDYLGGDNACMIEWPENAPEINANISVRIYGSGSDERLIEITAEEGLHDHSCG